MMAESRQLDNGRPLPRRCIRLEDTAVAGVARHHRPRILWAAIFLMLGSFFSVARASASITAPPIPTETLLVDMRSPMMDDDGQWTIMPQEQAELRRRAPAVRDGATTTFEIAVSTVSEQTMTRTIPASPLPSPFDSNLASNFTGNNGNGVCPGFINTFLTSPDFKQCYPFSLLLQGSRSFFNAAKSLVSITQVLDATCAANVTYCTSYLNRLAKNLTDPQICGEDYQLGNSIVVQAYLGSVAYESLFSAACLKDPETSMYCFANAVTNLTTTSNGYFYFLPLNITLPGSTIPSCSYCLQQTMAVFQSAAANRKLPIANTYQSAAQQVDSICGPGFVNDTLPAAVVSNGAMASTLGQGPSWLMLTLLLASALHVFL